MVFQISERNTGSDSKPIFFCDPSLGTRFKWLKYSIILPQGTVGIVMASFDAESHAYINKTTNGWGYYQADGKIGHGGPAGDSYGINFKCVSNQTPVVDGLCIPYLAVISYLLAEFIMQVIARQSCCLPVSTFLR